MPESEDDFLTPPGGGLDESFETAAPVSAKPVAPEVVLKPEVRRIVDQHPRERSFDRTLPHSDEAEEQVLGAILTEGDGIGSTDVIDRAIGHGLTTASFHSPANALIWSALSGLRKAGQPLGTATAMTALGQSLAAAGGIGRLMELGSAVRSTAQASFFIEQIVAKERLRQLIRVATSAVEHAYNGVATAQDVQSLLDEVRESTEHLSNPRGDKIKKGRKASDFKLQRPDDSRILLGNRYLNRGDGAVLSSTSGMGKSTLTLQLCILWCLGLPAFGIKPNGAKRILVIQSEDSDGDVAETLQSLRYALKLTAEQLATIEERLILVTDRTSRGAKFLTTLKSLIAEHTPDIVVINPLQAYIDGDITDPERLGKFLREGLNGINEPLIADGGGVGWLVVHHTTKPATGKDRSERLWHEVMYDMAGGAEIINWARAILSLRATETEGNFNLILAKRGRRAGVTKEVEQGAGVRLEPSTVIPLKHSTGKIEADGISFPLLFWEGRDQDAPKEGSDKKRGGRPSIYIFAHYRSVIPKHTDPGLPYTQLERTCIPNGKIPSTQFGNVLKRWEADGDLEVIRPERGPALYRAAL